MRLPFPTAHAAVLLRLTVEVLIEGGTRTCPSYSVLRRENDTTGPCARMHSCRYPWRMSRSHGRMHPDDPQSTTAAIVVYAAQSHEAPSRRDHWGKKKWTKQNQPRHGCTLLT